MEVGISEGQLHQQGSDFTGMEVWDREWSGHLSFDANGLIIENHRLEALLMARVVERGIPIRWSVQIRDSKVTEDAAWLDVDSGEQLESTLLVGADGAESRVRTILGIPTVNRHYEQQAVVAVLRSEVSHDKVARQWFTATGPLALLPLDDPNGVVMVWSSSDGEAMTSCPPEQLIALLARETDRELGTLALVSARATFPLKLQHALQYVKGRAVLIGDAAHSIHPLAGQGANLGFADASALGMAISQSMLEPGELLEKPLRAFEQARRRRNLSMTLATDGLTQLFADGMPSWLRTARSVGMRVLDQESRLKGWLTDAASGKL
jgi:2-octaprenylphenol hydroxylase